VRECCYCEDCERDRRVQTFVVSVKGEPEQQRLCACCVLHGYMRLLAVGPCRSSSSDRVPAHALCRVDFGIQHPTLTFQPDTPQTSKMARLLSAIALVSAILAGSALANEFTSPHVMHLTSKNYEEKVSRGSARRNARSGQHRFAERRDVPTPLPVPARPLTDWRRQGVLYQVRWLTVGLPGR
jgi:hypothetical protein